MTKVSIKLPVATTIKALEHKTVVIDWSKVPTNVLEELIVGGAKIILTNAYNGGGKAASEAEKLAQLEKRLDGWYRGEYAQAGGGDRLSSVMREIYIDRIREASGASSKQVEDSMSELVRNTYGEKEKATFGRFMDALSLSIAKAESADVDEVRSGIEADLTAEASKRMAEKANVVAKIDLGGLSLASFRK